MPTLLEICPATASDEQGISSKSHALIPGHQSHTTICVSWCLSHCQILDERRKEQKKVFSLVLTKRNMLVICVPAAHLIMTQHDEKYV